VVDDFWCRLGIILDKSDYYLEFFYRETKVSSSHMKLKLETENLGFAVSLCHDQ